MSPDLLHEVSEFLHAVSVTFDHCPPKMATGHLKVRCVELAERCESARRSVGRPPKNARNAEIVRLHTEERLNFTEIGERFDVTRERVRQIVRRAGVTAEQSAALRDKRREWVCAGGCGKREMRWPCDAARERCAACNAIASRGGPDGQPSRQHGPDGHWWCRDPRTGKRMRYERYLAQERIGRALRRDEWVTLADRDPGNLDPSNIVVTNASAVARRRYGHSDSIPTEPDGTE